MSSSSNRRPRNVAAVVRERVEQGGERLWRLEDFQGLSFGAVAQALSRLARAREIERLSKGTYYRTRKTAFGTSRPNPTAVRELATRRWSMFPSGLAAANLLGYSTQSSARGELSTSASSLPRKLVGDDTVVHTRRPAAWSELSMTDAAMLEFLRQGGRTSELSPRDTVRRTLKLLAEASRYQRLLRVAPTEPPRVRAMMGALGEELGKDPRALKPLRASLNQLSRFDFGAFSELSAARSWHAKG